MTDQQRVVMDSHLKYILGEVSLRLCANVILSTNGLANHGGCCLKYQVGLLQTAHCWPNTGVLLGGHMRREIAFETNSMMLW